jgi:hypothetical protein
MTSGGSGTELWGKSTQLSGSGRTHVKAFPTWSRKPDGQLQVCRLHHCIIPAQSERQDRLEEAFAVWSPLRLLSEVHVRCILQTLTREWPAKPVAPRSIIASQRQAIDLSILHLRELIVAQTPSRELHDGKSQRHVALQDSAPGHHSLCERRSGEQ